MIGDPDTATSKCPPRPHHPRAPGGTKNRGPVPSAEVPEVPVIYPVVTIDGAYFVQPPGAERRLITSEGAPCQFPPGWCPLFVYAGFAPIFLLELRHADGMQSTWFLDPRFARLAHDDPEALPAWVLPVLRACVTRISSRLWHQVLDGRTPALDAASKGFSRLGPAIRSRLAQLSEADFAIKVTIIDLAAARRDGARCIDTPAGAELAVDVLWRWMSSDLLARSLEAIQTGRLTWESPSGGRTLTTSGGIWLSDFLFAYRVVTEPRDLALYVLVSGHPCRVIGVLIPSAGIVLTNGRDYHENVEGLHGAPIERLLYRHLAEHGARMIDAWANGPGSPAVLFRERLISGQLWHDLTGLDLLVRQIPAAKLPEIIGMWGGVPEIYGDVEAIFPETEGRIARSLPDDAAMIRHAYEQRRLLLRTTGSYITKDLYSRIIAVNTRDPTLRRSRDVAADIARLGCPLVLLGLRVENRTVEDLPAFCTQIIDTVLRHHDGVAVVIDGHNSARGAASGQAFASEFQQHATEAPIEAERRVVRALAERFKDRPVVLINNIGGSMAQSIFWCHEAHFFVTMYGTGLAKYRWACNQTGLVVTSRWTLRNQGHLHIYEEDYLEDPSPLMFLPEAFIDDLPDSPLLITEPGNPPARWNFRIRPDGLEAAVEALLRANYPAVQTDMVDRAAE